MSTVGLTRTDWLVAIEASALADTTKRVARALGSCYAPDRGSGYLVPVREICARSGLADATVRRHIRKLLFAHYIEYLIPHYDEFSHDGRPNEYVLCRPMTETEADADFEEHYGWSRKNPPSPPGWFARWRRGRSIRQKMRRALDL